MNEMEKGREVDDIINGLYEQSVSTSEWDEYRVIYRYQAKLLYDHIHALEKVAEAMEKIRNDTSVYCAGHGGDAETVCIMVNQMAAVALSTLQTTTEDNEGKFRVHSHSSGRSRSR